MNLVPLLISTIIINIEIWKWICSSGV